jgi:hypothetical protein
MRSSTLAQSSIPWSHTGGASGRVAGRGPKSGCVAPGNKTSEHGPRGEAPPRCAGEGEAVGARPREPSANAASPTSAAGKDEGWQSRRR